MQPRYVGYSRELQEAAAALRTAPVVLVCGLPGSGKTAFLERLSLPGPATRIEIGAR